MPMTLCLFPVSDPRWTFLKHHSVLHHANVNLLTWRHVIQLWCPKGFFFFDFSLPINSATRLNYWLQIQTGLWQTREKNSAPHVHLLHLCRRLVVSHLRHVLVAVQIFINANKKFLFPKVSSCFVHIRGFLKYISQPLDWLSWKHCLV